MHKKQPSPAPTLAFLFHPFHAHHHSPGLDGWLTKYRHSSSFPSTADADNNPSLPPRLQYETDPTDARPCSRPDQADAALQLFWANIAPLQQIVALLTVEKKANRDLLLELEYRALEPSMPLSSSTARCLWSVRHYSSTLSNAVQQWQDLTSLDENAYKKTRNKQLLPLPCNSFSDSSFP